MTITLNILIGPKGSGKTTIGTLRDERTDIVFLRVAPIWLVLALGEDIWASTPSLLAFFRVAKRGLQVCYVEKRGSGNLLAEGMFAHHDALEYAVSILRMRADDKRSRYDDSVNERNLKA